MKLESVKNKTRRRKNVFVVVVAERLLSSIFQLLNTDSHSAFVAIQFIRDNSLRIVANHEKPVYTYLFIFVVPCFRI